MADNSLALRVDGLSDFRRGLSRANRDLGKKVGQANKALGERVVGNARSRYARHYTVRTGRTQRSIRASASQTRAQVKLGTQRTPWALGQEFGSDRLPRFRPWTGKAPGGKGSHGRFFYPAIREESEGIKQDYLKVLDTVVREAFPGG